jgi:SagB-type dehydrogenase family enzyme
LDDIAFALKETFGVQREVRNVFGGHVLKAYPSGGARHPIEVYLAARAVDGLAPGFYHYHPHLQRLTEVNGETALVGINDACFNKEGIESASVVVILTVRWLRHSWKYRYPRSYRMVLLEIGHALQAFCLAGMLIGRSVYSSYALNDTALLEMLDLGDDCAEMPVMVFGLGGDAE